MTPEELLEEWKSGEMSGMRPQRIKVLRDDLRRATGLSPPRRMSELEWWLNENEETIVDRLEAASSESDES